ncbi:hypothetical protein C5B94_03255 [Clavibacter michiganensis]|uniref:hypothetical protein n=1 Tax=Clavibacter michiganensis TaxID=28447 RepID=UPI000CE88DA4|nr:hypothetical protein [Clavibacter michiganensis]PPF56452.1 hypothetical protein C5B94_03255 [Clavibacter michiganensis]
MSTEPKEQGDEPTLVALLDEAAPRTPLADAISVSVLQEMAQGARWNAGRRRRRATPRAVVFGTVVALTIGGAGAAAAATFSGWEPWVANADATVHFTLPSGTACEYRIVVNQNRADAADFRVAQDFLRSTDVLAAADIDSELGRVIARQAAGDGTDADPAAQVPSTDERYYRAVHGAITNVVWDALEARGAADPVTGSELSLSSQSDCAGVTW